MKEERDYKADAEYYATQLDSALESWRKDNEWRDKRIAEQEKEIRRLRNVISALGDLVK